MKTQKIEIEKTYPSFDKMRFVVSAVSKENSRYAISCVKIEKDNIIATNGKVLHWYKWEDNSFDDGLYEVVKSNKSIVILLRNEDAGNFPKWEDIIPNYEDYFHAMSGEVDYHFTEKVIAMLGKKNIAVDKKWLKAFDEVATSWNVFFGEPDRPIYFVSDAGVQAVVMSFKGEYDKVEFKKKN